MISEIDEVDKQIEDDEKFARELAQKIGWETSSTRSSEFSLDMHY